VLREKVFIPDASQRLPTTSRGLFYENSELKSPSDEVKNSNALLILLIFQVLGGIEARD